MLSACCLFLSLLFTLLAYHGDHDADNADDADADDADDGDADDADQHHSVFEIVAAPQDESCHLSPTICLTPTLHNLH